jgi:signal transduction histidine kinase
VLAHDSRRVARRGILAPEHAAPEGNRRAQEDRRRPSDAKETCRGRQPRQEPLSSSASATSCARRSTPCSATPRFSSATRPSRGRASRQSIKVIRRSAEHLSGLIDGLLDISKIEAGRLQVYSNEINIQDFLDQIVDMFRPGAGQGADFPARARPALPEYRGTDEKRLRQILVNLLSNAHQVHRRPAMSRFESAIAARSRRFTGRGYRPRHSSRRRRADLRAVPARRGQSIRPMPGLGLGLTITQLLTNTLGGEIAVASERAAARPSRCG